MRSTPQANQIRLTIKVLTTNASSHIYNHLDKLPRSPALPPLHIRTSPLYVLWVLSSLFALHITIHNRWVRFPNLTPTTGFLPTDNLGIDSSPPDNYSSFGFEIVASQYPPILSQ